MGLELWALIAGTQVSLDHKRKKLTKSSNRTLHVPSSIY